MSEISEKHHNERVASLTRERLAAYPEGQAEAIARHYLSLIAVARDLNYLLRAKDPGIPNPACDQAIGYMASQIKAAHLKDFGLELEWKSPARRTDKENMRRFFDGVNYWTP